MKKVLTHQAEIVIPEALDQKLQTYISNGKLRLPMLPDVVMEILNICESSNGDAKKLEDVLHRDPTLAGHVLRLSHSPLYKSRMPITSLQQAIARLGMKQLAEMVYTITLENQAFKIDGFAQEVTTLWQHAIGTAFYTKSIARLQGYNVDKAFLWGLLHDVGQSVILLAISQLQSELDTVLDADMIVVAMEKFHLQAGGLLAERWKLPVIVKECILHHHHYRSAPTCMEAAMITCLADNLSYVAMNTERDEAIVDELRQHPVVSDLRLTSKQLDGLFDELDEAARVMDAMATR